MNVQWYPGHMTKAKRQMQEDLKLIDLIIELVDARVPLSSRNPDIDQLGQNKSRLILLNKADLADERQNEAWKEYFQKRGFHVVKVDSRNGSGMKTIQNVIQEACKEKIERDRRRGIKNRPIRAMVAGIPNVGKSTFINTFAGKACAKTGNRPGVTKGKQWIRLNKNVELLDTPGILWPKFEDQQVGIRLACVGSIKDDILNMEELALWLIEHLRTNYSGLLEKRYGISEEGTAVEILGKIARARGCLKKGEELDYVKASGLLFDDFRGGKIGRVTLEWAEQEKGLLKAGQLFPYEIVRDCIELEENAMFYDDIAQKQRILDVTWKSLPDYMPEQNAIAVVDGSGSMYWNYSGDVMPIHVAVSLGIYCAERNEGYFHNHFITFSDNPRLIALKGEDIFQKVEHCMSYNEVSNTDLEKVFRLILQSAVQHHVPPEELPKVIYVISDMEFDEQSGSGVTIFQQMKQEYQAAGYQLPAVVYWNVCSRNRQFPVKKDDTGAVLVSGCSPFTFQSAVCMTTPEKYMQQVLEGERYCRISA